MTLRYANGQTIEAVVLSQTDHTMRVALQGSDDVVELREVSGAWVSDECEVVQLSFSWQKPAPATASEADFICSPDLAARLIHLLVSADESEAGSQTSAIAANRVPAVAPPVV